MLNVSLIYTEPKVEQEEQERWPGEAYITLPVSNGKTNPIILSKRAIELLGLKWEDSNNNTNQLTPTDDSRVAIVRAYGKYVDNVGNSKPMYPIVIARTNLEKVKSSVDTTLYPTGMVNKNTQKMFGARMTEILHEHFGIDSSKEHYLFFQEKAGEEVYTLSKEIPLLSEEVSHPTNIDVTLNTGEEREITLNATESVN